MSRRKRKLPRGSQQGRALSPTQREEIHQLFLLTGNKSEVARRMKLSEGAVRKCLKEIANDPDPELVGARRKVRREMAETIRQKAMLAMGSVTEEDFEHGRIEIKDGNGNVVRYLEYGPSLMQKVTAGAILVDKYKIIEELGQALDEEASGNRLLVPGDIAGLLKGVRSKVKSLSILHVDLEREHPELSERLQAKMAEAEIVVENQPEIITLDDLDGNPEEGS